MQHPFVASPVAQGVLVRHIQTLLDEELSQSESSLDLLNESLERARATDGRLRPSLLWGNIETWNGIPNDKQVPHAVFFPERELRDRLLRGEDDSLSLPVEDSKYEDYDVAGWNPSGSVIEIDASRIVSADLPLLTLLARDDLTFNEYSFLLVVDGVGFSGVVTIESFEGVVARTALAAFVMELEFWSLELCHLFPFECLAALPQARRMQAHNRFKEYLTPSGKRPREKLNRRFAAAFQRGNHYGSAVASMMLDFTYLADKGVMLRKCKLTLELSASELKRLFEKAEKLRNWCVHPSDLSLAEILSFDELRALLRTMSQVIEVLKENVERETRARSKSGS